MTNMVVTSLGEDGTCVNFASQGSEYPNMGKQTLRVVTKILLGLLSFKIEYQRDESFLYRINKTEFVETWWVPRYCTCCRAAVGDNDFNVEISATLFSLTWMIRKRISALYLKMDMFMSMLRAMLLLVPNLMHIDQIWNAGCLNK